ncbi:hypothetical protein BGZ96_009721 [Linnemannia gamsii]|uniref:Uncharacterized protein n=1 Tax=Linnemannia gamsii TaxID=64522 RepID=A0ABQ7KDN0_9FUNG|nr:hypothetical protein BGZ96_009721 [Linnemannia gamsii]
MAKYNSTLALDCIAADPTSTTLYGITSGWNRDSNEKNFLLVKSLPNPDHVSLTMWSMVSQADSAPFSYWRPPFRTVDCTVSSKGVFTAFFRNANYLSPGLNTIPVGIQYDPATQKWASIRTLPYYGWTTDLWTHTSFYMNNNGVETLVHILTDEWAQVIRFGVLNQAENFLQLAGIWTLDEKSQAYTSSDKLDTVPWRLFKWSEPYQDLGAFRKPRSQEHKKIFYVDGHLYMTYYNYPSNVTIDSFTFTDPTIPPPPSRKVFKGPEKFSSSYFFTGTQGNVTFLGGLGRYKKTNLTEEYSSFTMNLVDGVPQTPTVHISPFYNRTFTEFVEEYGMTRPTDTVAIHDNFVSVGGQLPGQTPFVVGLASEGIFEFSIVGKNGTTTLGMVEVIVPGFYSSISHRAQNLIDYSRELIYQQGNAKHESKTSEKIGIAAACFIGLFIIFKLSRGRKARNRAAAEAQQQEQQQQRQERRRRQQQQYGDIELNVRRTNAGIDATNPAVVAYEEQIANQYLTRESPLDFVATVDEINSPSVYEGNGAQLPKYSRYPRPDVDTSLSSGVQA